MRLRIPAAVMLTLVCVNLAGLRTVWAQDNFDADLKAIRDRWAVANYKEAADQREAAVGRLLPQAAEFSAKYPGRPEALIWDGIVLSTYAGLKGGFGAMGPAKAARARFEAALQLDEKAMDAAAHTSLGTLYHKVPGFPLAFGSDKKARMHLERALQISPDAIDANYFFGEFLYDEGEYAKALEHLERALKAPPRPGREIADEGRRQEIRALIAKTHEELR